MVVSMSDKRARKDRRNRKKGLARLQKRVKTGKLTKSSINNRGYNKYLRLEGEIKITIDEEKFTADALWDGIKGYITNTKLPAKKVIESYGNLWYIERAFRMNKTDFAHTTDLSSPAKQNRRAYLHLLYSIHHPVGNGENAQTRKIRNYGQTGAGTHKNNVSANLSPA